MKFILSLILALFFGTVWLAVAHPLASLTPPFSSLPVLVATATPLATDNFVTVHVLATPDSLTLYVPQPVSLNGFQWGYVNEGAQNYSKLMDSFDGLQLTNGMVSRETCYVYVLIGTSPPLSQLCNNKRVFRKLVTPDGVFWYDVIANEGKDLIILRDGEYTNQDCSHINPNCSVNWEVKTSPAPDSTAPKIGIAPLVNCSLSPEQIWDKVNPILRDVNAEATINEIVDQTVARTLAEQKHYDVLIWWRVDSNEQTVMQIEVLKEALSKDIQELSTIQLALDGCDVEHAALFVMVFLRYLYANRDDYTAIDSAFDGLRQTDQHLLPPTFKGQVSPSEAALTAFFRANMQLYKGQPDYSKAIDYYLDALKVYPNWSAAYFNQGIAYFNLGYVFLYKADISDLDKANALQAAKNLAVDAFSNANKYSTENEIKAAADLNSAQVYYMLSYLSDDGQSNSADYRLALGNCTEAGNTKGVSVETQAQADVCHAAIEIQRCGQLPLYFGINCGSEADLKPAMDYLDSATEKDSGLIDIYLWRSVAFSLQYEYGCRLDPPVFETVLKPAIEENLKKYWQVAQARPIKLRIDNTTLAYAYKGFGIVECSA